MNKNEFLAFSLPYGLKVYVKYYNHRPDNSELETMIGIVDDRIITDMYEEDMAPLFVSNYGLCLHPLSDLTKEIEHKGERFVPMIELAKLEGLIPSERIAITADGDIRLRLMLDPENKRSLTPVDFILDITECVFKIQCTTWHSMQVKTQREMQKKLLEWHFDIADLISKGEAIDVNELKFNPYK